MPVIRALLAGWLAAGALAGCTQSGDGAMRSPAASTRSSSAGPATTPTPQTVRSPRPTPAAPGHATQTARVSSVAPLSPRARAAGLRDIRTIVPDAIVDLRYATRHNFTGVRLYPTHARCLVHRSMARGLRVAAHRLRRHGLRMVFWDCYRPHRVQVRMFGIVPDPNWVARPGPYATSHEAGRSVDVTLARAGTHRPCPRTLRIHRRCLLVMGTGFDNFTPHAYAYATAGVSARAQRNRARLRAAMRAGGITVYSGEWWHFDGPGALVPRAHLHAPLQ